MIEQIKKQLKNPDSVVSLFLGIAVVVVTTMLVVNYVKGKGEQTAADVKTKEEAAKQIETALPATHTVVAGESLWKISEKYFQSGYNWIDITEANKLSNADVIEEGQTLTIPKVEKREPARQALSAATEVKKPENGKYTIIQGDTLWGISEKTYGTGYRWTEIASLNKLNDANIIHTGNVLQLP
ncbi:MAG: LysM peptidoglycan-binding domain-containing protein [Patescibacteria group bacterium]